MTLTESNNLYMSVLKENDLIRCGNNCNAEHDNDLCVTLRFGKFDLVYGNILGRIFQISTIKMEPKIIAMIMVKLSL